MITLWELGGREGRRYSLFSWRARMALAHKGLQFETRPVCLSDKAAIAFSGGKTVPVIRDGETVVRDSWVDRTLVVLMMKVVAPDIHERVDPADTEYFRGMAEGVTGTSLEEMRAGRDEALRRLGRGLEPMQALLKRQAYVCGAEPAYGDYILFSLFQWARVMSPHEVLAPEDPLSGWRERVLDLFDGFARNVPDFVWSLHHE